MLDENDFRKRADAALDSLKKSLMEAEESAEIEVEDQSGALHVSFEDRQQVHHLAQRSRPPNLDFGAGHEFQAGLVG